LRSSAVIVLAVSIVAVLTLLVGGCGGGGGNENVSATGVVRDAGTLAVIVGARAVGSSSQAITNDSGVFTLDDAPAGGTIGVTAAGYQAQQVSVPEGTGQQDLGTIYLVPSPLNDCGLVTGTITIGVTPADGATVTAGGQTATTRDDGTYTIYNVPDGAQTVRASKVVTTAGGQVTKRGKTSVVVTSVQAATANISLKEWPPDQPF
jgi:hypothetical protein